MRNLLIFGLLLAACEKKPTPVEPTPPTQTVAKPIAAAKPPVDAGSVETVKAADPVPLNSAIEEVGHAIGRADWRWGEVLDDSDASGYSPAPLQLVRKFTTVAPIKGRVVEDAGKPTRIEVNLDGWKLVGLVPEGGEPGCLPGDWVHYGDIMGMGSSDYIKTDRRTLALRIELGELEGGPAWLRLGGRDMHLVRETDECATIESMDFVLSPLIGEVEQAGAGQLFKDGKWKIFEPTDAHYDFTPHHPLDELAESDLKLREVPGGIEVLQEAKVLQKLSFPPGWENSCTQADVKAYTTAGRLTGIEIKAAAFRMCDPEGKEAENSREWIAAYAREGDEFKPRYGWQSDPGLIEPRVWRGDALEWRQSPAQYRTTFRVEPWSANPCGHEIFEEHYDTTWDVRPVGGSWTTLGRAERYRYTKTDCIEGAGEP